MRGMAVAVISLWEGIGRGFGKEQDKLVLSQRVSGLLENCALVLWLSLLHCLFVVVSHAEHYGSRLSLAIVEPLHRSARLKKEEKLFFEPSHHAEAARGHSHRHASLHLSFNPYQTQTSPSSSPA